MLTQGSLSKNVKSVKNIVNSLDVRRTWMCYIGHHYAFDHNFWTKARNKDDDFGVYMYVFKVWESDGAICFIYDIDLSRSWPLRNHILGHISITNGQIMAKI